MSVREKIYIAGHTGLVGLAAVRYFKARKNWEVLTVARREVDLTRQSEVESFLQAAKPDVIFMSCGRVGGIQANSAFPAEFVYQNLMMGANLIHAAWKTGVKKVVYFGSSCIYPKECAQPMEPESLMTGRLEPTNEPYAMSKLSGMSLISSYNRQYKTGYMNVIPSNLYGPGDNMDPSRSHVIAALLAKFHAAKKEKVSEVTLWGSGNVTRDFLYVEDLIEACDFLLHQSTRPETVNVGALDPCTIKCLAETIAEVTGFSGKIQWDLSKPDGAPTRILGTEQMTKLGWKAKIKLKEGLEKTYQWYKENLCAS